MKNGSNGHPAFSIGDVVTFSEEETKKLQAINVSIVERKVQLADTYMRLNQLMGSVGFAEHSLMLAVSDIMKSHGIDVDATKWNIDLPSMSAKRTE